MKTPFRRYVFFFALPIAIFTVFLVLEELSWSHPSGSSLNGELTQVQNRVVSLSKDLGQFFITLTTALIGGIAYYLKASPKVFGRLSRFAVVALVATLLAAVLSIFFGHLWLSNLRSQLAADYFEPTGYELVWPERMQYFFFIASISWFGIFALERELTRARNKETQSSKADSECDSL